MINNPAIFMLLGKLEKEELKRLEAVMTSLRKQHLEKTDWISLSAYQEAVITPLQLMLCYHCS